MKSYLGIEFGSTRIKAVSIDENCHVLSEGDYLWKSSCEEGIWTYDLQEVWKGLNSALEHIQNRDAISAAGISAMMHGYLAFDRDWNLLVPFRTWQNTMTKEAADRLTELFGFNIPQRWSIAHLYQAILNGEPHVSRIAHLTTLAGYVHYRLTGVNALGIGDASGMFPIDSEALSYDRKMLDQFDALTAEKGYPWKIRDVLPSVLTAGAKAGNLTEEGAALINHLLPAGIPFAPPEGDAGTGMTATNAVAPRTGNISAGTSIFSMVVLEHALKRIHREIDLVTTPTGMPVAMVHCNNCTNDMNAWISVLQEAAVLLGADPTDDELFTRLYRKSLEGDADCGGITVFNYMSGEGVTGMDEGRPMVIRSAGCSFTLANLMRAQLYAAVSTLKTGMDILFSEHVQIDSITGHGGMFKTPMVGQRYLAAACRSPITVMETAGEGGPYGMALLAAYSDDQEDETLEQFLNARAFADARRVTVAPAEDDARGFESYHKRFTSGLAAEREAIRSL